MRRGFTLVEILVVIVIIGMLVGMLLPAILSVRETGRRTMCVQNLSQLGVALGNYETAHEALPTGTHGAPGPIRNTAKGVPLGWLAELLPYLDQAVVYKHVDFKVGADHPHNALVRAMNLPPLRCPSSYSYHEQKDENIAFCHYAACHHDVEAPIDRDNHGMFFLDSRLSSREIPDGAMYTIFVGEKRTDSSDLGWLSGTRATLRNTGTPIHCGRNPDSSSAGEEPPTDALYVGGFGASHVGGANFLFGDSAVRFLNDQIDDTLYRYLGHRADGHLLPSFSQFVH